MPLEILPPVESFQAFLDTVPTLGETARKTYRSGYRRILRDFYPEDCTNPITVNQYRISLKHGTRNVFDSTWFHLRVFFAQEGIDLPAPPPMNRIRHSHPLAHDLMTLTGYLNVPQLSVLTWGTMPENAVNEQTARALERIYEFQTGNTAFSALPTTPIVPTRFGAAMREWEVEFVINSLHHETDHIIDRFASKVSEALVFANVNGIALRDYMTAYWKARPGLTRSTNPEKLIRELLTMVKSRDFATFRRQLADRASDKMGDAMW
jgi:hypothetical protein